MNQISSNFKLTSGQSGHSVSSGVQYSILHDRSPNSNSDTLRIAVALGWREPQYHPSSYLRLTQSHTRSRQFTSSRAFVLSCLRACSTLAVERSNARTLDPCSSIFTFPALRVWSRYSCAPRPYVPTSLRPPLFNLKSITVLPNPSQSCQIHHGLAKSITVTVLLNPSRSCQVKLELISDPGQVKVDDIQLAV